MLEKFTLYVRIYKLFISNLTFSFTPIYREKPNGQWYILKYRTMMKFEFSTVLSMDRQTDGQRDIRFSWFYAFFTKALKGHHNRITDRPTNRQHHLTILRSLLYLYMKFWLRVFANVPIIYSNCNTMNTIILWNCGKIWWRGQSRTYHWCDDLKS